MTSAMARCLSVLLAIGILPGCQLLHEETADGSRVRRWSDEWYQMKAQLPPGARQRMHHGKLWPPFPRPTDERQQFSHKFHTAHYWPYPYVCHDRQFVRMLSERQVQNGWTKQTTLYDYHFDEESHELNHSGLMQLRWILGMAPEQYRHVSVQSGISHDISQARVDAVRAESILIAGEAKLPSIDLRITEPLGRPAIEVNKIQIGVIDTMPDPRITYTALPTGSSGGE